MTINSAAEFVRLRSSDDPADYRRAASEDAPMEVWEELVIGYPEYRKWVAHNKTVPMEILRRLADDNDREVRVFVAMKRKLESDILEHLSGDDDSGIRLRVAMHKNTPQSVLARLAHDESDRVRDAANSRLR